MHPTPTHRSNARRDSHGSTRSTRGGASSLSVFGLFALLSVVVATTAAPWAFGGVQPKFQFYLFVAVLVSLVCCWLDLVVSDRSKYARPPIAVVPLLLAIGLGVFQLTPLPRNLHTLIAPRSEHLWRSLAGDADQSLLGFAQEASGERGEASTGRLPELDNQGAARSARYPISLYPASTRHDLLWLVAGASVFLLGALLFRTALPGQALLWIASANGLALAFFGLVQQLSWNGKLFWSVPLTRGGVPFASFVCKNNAGGFLNLGLATAIGLLVWYLGKTEREYLPQNAMSIWDRVLSLFSRLNGPTLATLLMAGFIAAGILSSLSRGAVVAMVGAGVVTMLAVQLTHGFRTRASWLFTGIGLAALALVGWIGRSDVVQQRMSTLLTESEVVAQQRVPHWQDVLHATSDFWTLGSGLGTQRHIYHLYQATPSDYWFYHAENQYLEALLEGGLVGLGLMLIMITLVARASLRLLRQGPTDSSYAWGVAGTFALASQAIASSFDFGLYLPANMLLFALLCGVTTGLAANLEVRDNRSRRNRTGAVIGRFTSLLRKPALTVSLVTALVCVIWLGVQEMRRGAECEVIRAQATELLDTKDVPAEALRDANARLQDVLAASPDDAQARQLSASLWTRLYRVETAGRNTSASAGARDRSQAWEATSPRRVHESMHRMAQTNRHVDLQNLRETPEIQRNLTRAFEQLALSRRACPLLAAVHVHLAELTGVVADPAADAIHLRRARQLAPADPDLLLYVGALELEAGRPEAACASWRACLDVAPNRADVVLDYASEALDLSQHVDCLLPDSPELLIRIAQERFASREYSELRRAITAKASRLIQGGNLEEGERCFLAGSILALNDQHLKAIQQVARAVQLRPDHTTWRFELARLMQRRGLADQAREQAKICVQQDPDNDQYKQLLQELIHARATDDKVSNGR